METDMSKTCIITGASRGIGLAAALRFAKAGYDIVAAARSPGPLEAAARQIQACGVACEALPVDISEAAGARELIEVATKRFGRIDVLVNNAGTAPLSPIDQMSDEVFDDCLRLNCGSVFFLTRAVWATMRRQRSGTIVNVSSVASIDPFPGFAVYGACKTWVNAFTQAVAREGQPLGIRVFCVAPGAVETQMLREHFPDFPRDQTLAPDEVARLIEAVCDPSYDRQVGQTLFIDKPSLQESIAAP
jgi:NAD(P)-dependent dehydrogenase (short-subunit alcohol dehydrogenase family)